MLNNVFAKVFKNEKNTFNEKFMIFMFKVILLFICKLNINYVWKLEHLIVFFKAKTFNYSQLHPL